MNLIDPAFESIPLLEAAQGALIYRMQYHHGARLRVVLKHAEQNNYYFLAFDGPVPHIESVNKLNFELPTFLDVALVWSDPDLQIVLDQKTAFYNDTIFERNGAILLDGKRLYLHVGTAYVNLENWTQSDDLEFGNRKLVAFNHWSLTVRKPGTEKDRMTIADCVAEIPRRQ